MSEEEIERPQLSCSTTFLSKRLKELYVPWDKKYCWLSDNLFSDDFMEWKPPISIALTENEVIPAYTADHLESLVLKVINIGGVEYHLHAEQDSRGLWYLSYRSGEHVLTEPVVHTPFKADAYGELLQYLLENKYMNPEDLYD